MTVASIGEALLAASSYLGLGALRGLGGRRGADADEAGPASPALSEDAFDAGEPVFEAVASALGKAGYL